MAPAVGMEVMLQGTPGTSDAMNATRQDSNRKPSRTSRSFTRGWSLLCSHKSSAAAAGPRRLLRVALLTCRQPGIPRRGLPISSWPRLDKYFEVKSHRGIKNINVLRSSQVTKTFLSSKGNLTGGDFFLWKGVLSEAVLARQRKTLSTHSVWELLETHLGITEDTLHPRPPPRCPLRPSTATLQGLPEGPSPA